MGDLINYLTGQLQDPLAINLIVEGYIYNGHRNRCLYPHCLMIIIGREKE